MGFKYCTKRRLFLKEMSASLGLAAASNLFSLKAFSQSTATRKNLVCLYFLHTGNIDFNPGRGFGRGTFHADDGGDLDQLRPIKDDLVFIRGVDHTLLGSNQGENHHDINPASAFSGHAIRNRHETQLLDLVPGDDESGTSIDLLIGRHMQNKYPETQIPFELLSQAKDIVGVTSNNNFGSYRYKTCSSERVKGKSETKVLNPTINPKDFYSDIQKSKFCDSGNQVQVDNSEKIRQLNVEVTNLNFTKDNLSSFRSRYLLPNEEFDKLKDDIGRRIANTQSDIKKLQDGESIARQCPEVPTVSDFEIDRRNPNFENKARKHINDHFKLITYGLKYDYMRSATVHANDWASDNNLAGQKYKGTAAKNNYMHAVGHDYIGNPSARFYVHRIGIIVNDLVTKLKNAGIYNETMIAVTCEYPHQNMGSDPSSNGGGLNHRSDNLPWLIINSGARAVDHNLGTKKMIHPSDIQIAIMNRFGINKSQWGTSNFGKNAQLGDAYNTQARRGNRSLVGII